MYFTHTLYVVTLSKATASLYRFIAYALYTIIMHSSYIGVVLFTINYVIHYPFIMFKIDIEDVVETNFVHKLV